MVSFPTAAQRLVNALIKIISPCLSVPFNPSDVYLHLKTCLNDTVDTGMHGLFQPDSKGCGQGGKCILKLSISDEMDMRKGRSVSPPALAVLIEQT